MTTFLKLPLQCAYPPIPVVPITIRQTLPGKQILAPAMNKVSLKGLKDDASENAIERLASDEARSITERMRKRLSEMASDALRYSSYRPRYDGEVQQDEGSHHRSDGSVAALGNG